MATGNMIKNQTNIKDWIVQKKFSINSLQKIKTNLQLQLLRTDIVEKNKKEWGNINCFYHDFERRERYEYYTSVTLENQITFT